MRNAWTLGIISAFAAVIVGAGPVAAGTKFQTSLVPTVAGTPPGFSASGSSLFIDGHRQLKGKIKKVVDGAGLLVTTDGTPSLDDYRVEIDLTVAATATTGTAVVKFDVKNGNGKFSASLSGDPVFTGAAVGDGVAVTGIRVKDGSGTVIGTGGFAVE